MGTETKETKENTKIEIIKHRIPDELVYEIMNGKPIYYKGYKDVIENNYQISNIMGSSSLQSILIDIILRKLYNSIDTKKYSILTNELGLHLNKKDNLAADISIFERKKLFSKKIENKYEKTPPKIIIEIDTKADLNDFDNVMDYYTQKTKKLFDFGVEKVFWILTKNKQIIEAIPKKDWLVKTWDKEIQLFNNMKFTIDQLLKQDGIYDLIYYKK